MNDLISREELTKKLEYLCDCLCDYSKRQREVMCDSCKLGAVIDAVEEMPSVEPERKTGKWIKVVNPDTNEWVGGFKCSECDRDCVQMSMNYCANCGAPMEVDG